MSVITLSSRVREISCKLVSFNSFGSEDIFFTAMGNTCWFLVDSLVVLLSTAAVADQNEGCWSTDSYLKHYYCSGNFFGDLSIKNFDPNRTHINLTDLFLTSNKISSVKHDVFKHLNKLESLVLSHNLISWLDDRLFSNLISLLLLDLSFNRLSNLSHGLFSTQKRLKTLILDGNELITISESTLTPLSSIRRLGLSNNPLVCDCKLCSALLWCTERLMDTNATCQNQLSVDACQRRELQFCNNSKNQDPGMLSESSTQLTNRDDTEVADISAYVVPLFIVGAVVLQLLFFCLYLIYLGRKHRNSVTSAVKERSMRSDSRSVHDSQYEYIQIPNIYVPPQLPARPTRTTEDLDQLQVPTCQGGVHLKEPGLSGTNTLYARCQEINQMTKPQGNTSHSENHRALRSEIIPTSMSYDPPVYEDPSKTAVSNGIINNKSSDTGVLVENSLYSLVDTLK